MKQYQSRGQGPRAAQQRMTHTMKRRYANGIWKRAGRASSPLPRALPVHLTHGASPTLRRHLYTTSLYTTGVRQFYTTSLYTTRQRGYTFHLPVKFVPSRPLSVTMCLGPWGPGSLGPWVPRPRVLLILFPGPSFSYPQGQRQSKKTQAKAKNKQA